jgi:ABC-2 type transport system ATP-binding protein
MKNVIEIKNLSKKYGSLTAVDNISFKVVKGEIFGLLGENGAGKTITLETIEGLRKATSGEVGVLGRDVETQISNIKQKIGVQLQSSAYYDFLTLREILSLFSSFYRASLNLEDLFKMVKLENKQDSYLDQLSGGQKQRFSIIASLINDPEIVFLDEPTTGLDPLARRNLWDVITDIKKQGKTVILTTHYMEEAEQLCDRVAIMEKGKILTIGPTHKLIRQVDCPYKISFVDPTISDKTKDQLSSHGNLDKDLGKDHSYILRLKRQADTTKALKVLLKTNPESFEVSQASLEDLFIQLTGKEYKE